jgi:SAM-dependent methyltransferase
MKTRGQWQGMLTIVRLNWTFYLVAVLALFLGLSGILWLPGLLLKFCCGLVFMGASYFVFVSLGVSHWIYDLSDLYRWTWLERALRGEPIDQAIFCHSGFDESSEMLRLKLGGVNWRVLDHFDEKLMTEASILRARAQFPPTPGTVTARYEAWPVESESTDVVFGLLAIHELRSETERGRWFAEARRSLRKEGRIVVVEHVRDWANFLAFGPGFFHFHPKASWQRCWESAGFRAVDEFCLTPFVRVFVLSVP